MPASRRRRTSPGGMTRPAAAAAATSRLAQPAAARLVKADLVNIRIPGETHRRSPEHAAHGNPSPAQMVAAWPGSVHHRAGKAAGVARISEYVAYGQRIPAGPRARNLLDLIMPV